MNTWHHIRLRSNHKQNALTQVVGNYVHPRTGLTFAMPIYKNRKVSKWWKICMLIRNNETRYNLGMTKNDVVTFLFDRPSKEWKNWGCDYFAALNKSGLLKYNTETRLWNVGPKFNTYLETLLHMHK